MDSSTIAVVTGAARGIGRGTALVLGEAGATVYVTDRESRGRRYSDLPGTVEDTAEQVTARGGTGIGVVVDHADDKAVAALFDRIRAEQGGIDLMVANAFNGNALPFVGGPFWTLPLEHWSNMVDVGVRSHMVSAWHAAPLLIERRGLLVFTGYTDPGSEVLGGHVFYDLAMTAVKPARPHRRARPAPARRHGAGALAGVHPHRGGHGGDQRGPDSGGHRLAGIPRPRNPRAVRERTPRPVRGADRSGRGTRLGLQAPRHRRLGASDGAPWKKERRSVRAPGVPGGSPRSGASWAFVRCGESACRASRRRGDPSEAP